MLTWSYIPGIILAHHLARLCRVSRDSLSPDFSPAFEAKPIVDKSVGDGEDVAKQPR